jgi:prephenate dehydratase
LSGSRFLSFTKNEKRKTNHQTDNQERTTNPKSLKLSFMLKVAFQGILGANSEVAALHALSSANLPQDLGVEPIGFEGFAQLLESVESGVCDLAALPIENSLAGTVIPALDLLFNNDLYAIGEVLVRVRHQFMSLPGVPLERITKVYSHPQALAQCAGFIQQHGLQAIPSYDTAGSAQDLAHSREPGAACIASARAAQLYGLEILAQDIEDEDFNTTRFLILSSTHSPKKEGISYKTSMVFAVRNQPGSLVSALNAFAGINMTKLESRPRRDRPWSYLFYLDFEGHTEDANVQNALAQLLNHASIAKVLGSYPVATQTV